MWPYKELGKLPRQLLLREMCREAAYKQAQRATCPGGPRRGAVADADLAGLLQEPGRSHRNSLSLTWNVIVGYSQINKWAFLPSLLLLCNITVFWVCVRVCVTSAKCKYSHEKWKIWIHICVFLFICKRCSHFFTKNKKQLKATCDRHTDVIFKGNCVGTCQFLVFLSANNSWRCLIEALLPVKPQDGSFRKNNCLLRDKVVLAIRSMLQSHLKQF